jgi:hypothetical protein
MHARRDARDLEPRQFPVERREQRRTSPAEAPARPAQVTLEVARLDEPCERDLVDGRRSCGVGRPDAFAERGGHDGPAEPQTGCDRLRERPDEHRALGCHGLEGRDRAPVVAELGVVVVLDEDGVDGACPAHDRLAARRRECGARRELMGRREERCA